MLPFRALRSLGSRPQFTSKSSFSGSLPLPSLLSSLLSSTSVHTTFGSSFSTSSAHEEDMGSLKEYSVVYTDRALNHMSSPFQSVMNDLYQTLTSTYNAEEAIIMPGSGTFAMEAVARQFGLNQRCLVLRNGFFSFRWSAILDQGGIPKGNTHTVLKAGPTCYRQDPLLDCYAPFDIDHFVHTIQTEKPDVVFAPHVETSLGMMLPNDYIKRAAEATQSVGGVFVLDCIASGALWLDMKELKIDVLITAPQKGWSGPACTGLVMLSQRAQAKMEHTQSDSFSCDLKSWSNIMKTYLNGAFGYHTTMPTDALRLFRDVTVEMADVGMDLLEARQIELGHKTRRMMESHGLLSVAAPGYEAPGVLVYYTDDASTMPTRMANAGLQIAAGVPFKIGEPDDVQTFRIGLFGIDKLLNVDATVSQLEQALLRASQ